MLIVVCLPNEEAPEGVVVGRQKEMTGDFFHPPYHTIEMIMLPTQYEIRSHKNIEENRRTKRTNGQKGET